MGTAEDPDARQAAVGIRRVFRLEEVRAFCREVWRRLALLGVVWTLMAGVLPGLRAGLESGLALIVLAAVAAAIVEAWAAVRLDRALSRTR